MKRSHIVAFALVVMLFVASSVTYAQGPDTTYIIGNVSWAAPGPFVEEMASLGYVEGENITYMYVPYDETIPMEEYQAYYEAQVQLMVDAGADVFVTNTDTDAINLQPLVGDTPIVFERSDDPVATGAIADLVTPGGTMTGTMTNRPHERRLQILTEILPSTDKVLYLYSPLTMEAETVLAQVNAVAAELGIEIIPAQTPDGPTGIEALENIPEGVDWLFVTPYIPYFDVAFMDKLLATSMEHQAGIAWIIDEPVQGYLMGYGPNIAASDRQAAQIVDRILRGASPADLPVQIAENYLWVNLETAEAFNMEIPLGVLRQANTIIHPGYFDTLPQAEGAPQ
ncbi:MAG: ABC transporter substrate-binding protein [Anaerolineae bacterium]|nr:ABC transporter substrate-binding protein [Anaerolineae bacterium]